MPLSILDTHQHLWDLAQLHLPWVASIESLNRSFLTEDYLNYTSQNSNSEFDYSIDQTLYMEVDVAGHDIKKEIELIVQLCRDPLTPTSGIIAACRPGDGEFAQSLETAQTYAEIRGFRRVLHTEETPQGFCLASSFVDDIQTLGSHNLTFDICIRRQELSDAAELARRCPETQFVLDHCGNAEARMTGDEFERWAKDMQSVAMLPNVACKVSGFVWTIQNGDWTYEKDIEPILQTVFDAFGSDRILFGGDWPVCTMSVLSFQQWLNSLYRFANDHGEATVAKLFSENAQRIYRA